jgi:hypothetical protein
MTCFIIFGNFKKLLFAGEVGHLLTDGKYKFPHAVEMDHPPSKF